MRTFVLYINKKPISFQVTMAAAVRFEHLYEKDVSDGTQVQIQNWDKRNTLQRKNRTYTLPSIF